MSSLKANEPRIPRSSYNTIAISFADSTTKNFGLYEIRCQIFSVHEDRKVTDMLSRVVV